MMALSIEKHPQGYILIVLFTYIWLWGFGNPSVSIELENISDVYSVISTFRLSLVS